MEIFDQGGGGLVHLASQLAVVFGEVFVAVPVAAREAVVGATPNLDEAHAALEQPPGREAAAAEIGGDFFIEPIELASGSRLAGDFEHFRSAHLQLGGHLIRADAGFEAGVRAALGHVGAVELLENRQAIGFRSSR